MTGNNTKSNKDNNAVVTNGAIINGAEVTDKRQQAVVLKYEFEGKSCTGVMHISQFPALDRNARDEMFVQVQVGDKFDGLEASVELADKEQGRRFTSVRLSGRKPLEKVAQEKRNDQQSKRNEREAALKDAIEQVTGTVVKAKVHKLAFAKDKDSGEESDHCYGAFLRTDVNGVEVGGLLHTSRMVGKGRIDRLVAAYEQDSLFEVIVLLTERGVAFSEEGVEEARKKVAAEALAVRLSTDRDSFLTRIREALAAGTPEKQPFLARVTENHLDSDGGVVAESCGTRIEVTSEDLNIRASSMRGVGHQLKLMAMSVSEDGVIKARRFMKVK